MEARLAPPHSIIFIHDAASSFQVPVGIGAGLVWATDTCVVVGTLAEVDGETTIRLAPRFSDPEGQIAFEGMIKTPGGAVAISTSLGEQLVAIPVGQAAQITVWVNDPSEPDLILVRARMVEGPKVAYLSHQQLWCGGHYILGRGSRLRGVH